MTYNEKRLAVAETQLELVVAGFDKISNAVITNGGDNLAELFEPYIEAIMDLKAAVKYLREEVEEAKTKK